MSEPLRRREGDAVTEMPAIQAPGAPHPERSCRVAEIAPADARELLVRHGGGARRHEAQVHLYAAIMRSGAWQLNGMPLIFSRGGVLLDGAQRLFACLEAGTAFTTVIAERVDDEVAHTIDQHRRRTTAPPIRAEPIRADPAAPAPGPAGPIEVGIETVDPARAAALLARGSAARRISRKHVAALARDLAQGRWLFNAQPLCFAADGTLLNGRHRLEAVVLSGRSMEVAVVRGLAAAAGATYDTHPRRGAVLGDPAEAFGDRALAHAMANLLWHHERRDGTTPNAKATAAEIHQIIANHPRLLQMRGFARRMDPFGRASVLGYAAYVMERQDPALARRFLEALETGADMRPTHPVLALRGTMQLLRGSKAPATVQLVTLLEAWRRFRLATPIGRRV